MDYTLRGVDDDLWKAAKKKAIDEGISLKALIIRLLEKATK